MSEYLTLAQIKQSLADGRPRRRFIIPGVVPSGPCLLFGASGSGKTGLSIRTAVSVAAGLQWAGKDVERGSVLYIAGEDFDGVQDRIAAASQYLGVSDEIPLAVMEANAAGMISDMFRSEIEFTAGKLAKQFNTPLSLIVIDTLAACFGPKSQDDATAAGEYMNNADKLSRRIGCAVLSIHHTGKNENSGMRGSRVFFDRADSVVEVKRGKSNTSFANVDKLRNGRGGARFAFDIDGLDIPTSDGAISVQIVRELNSLEAVKPASRDDLKSKSNQNDAAAALGILLGLTVEGKASRKGWQSACYSAWEHKVNHNARKNAFSKALKKLTTDGSVTVSNDTVTVTVTVPKNMDTPSGYPASPDTVTVTVPVSPFIGGRGDGRYRPDTSSQKKESSEHQDGELRPEEIVARSKTLLRGSGDEIPEQDYCADGDGYVDGRAA